MRRLGFLQIDVCQLDFYVFATKSILTLFLLLLLFCCQVLSIFEPSLAAQGTARCSVHLILPMYKVQPWI